MAGALGSLRTRQPGRSPTRHRRRGRSTLGDRVRLASRGRTSPQTAGGRSAHQQRAGGTSGRGPRDSSFNWGCEEIMTCWRTQCSRSSSQPPRATRAATSTFVSWSCSRDARQHGLVGVDPPQPARRPSCAFVGVGTGARRGSPRASGADVVAGDAILVGILSSSRQTVWGTLMVTVSLMMRWIPMYPTTPCKLPREDPVI
jgi:hypothetical protein